MSDKNKKITLVLLCISCVILLLFGTNPIRNISYGLDFVVTSSVFILMNYVLMRIFSLHKKLVFYTIISTIIVIILVLSVLYGRPPAYLPNILGYLLACLTANILFNGNVIYAKVLMLILFIVIGFWYYLTGNYYYVNYIHEGSFSGKTNQIIDENWHRQINEFKVNGIDGKVIVIYMYLNNDKKSVRAFPKFQKLYNKFSSDSNFLIYAVNLPATGDIPENTISLVKQHAFTFPVIIGNDTLEEIFKLRSFPEVLLIKKNHLLYKGNVECAEEAIKDQINIK